MLTKSFYIVGDMLKVLLGKKKTLAEKKNSKIDLDKYHTMGIILRRSNNI